MSTLREAAQQALEALELCGLTDTHRSYEVEHAARTALRAALAQQEPQYTTGHCKERAKPNGCQLHNLHCGYPECDRKPAALAQEEQEPVAWANSANIASSKVTRERGGQGDVHTWSETKSAYHDKPLYTHPPRREWRSLSEEKIDWLLEAERMKWAKNSPPTYEFAPAFARAIEAALKEKNA